MRQFVTPSIGSDSGIARAHHQPPVHHRARWPERCIARSGCGCATRTAARAGAKRRPAKFYGETAETRVCRAQPVRRRSCPTTPSTSRRRNARSRTRCADNPAARAAVSTALHDLVGKRLGVPLYRLWGLDPKATPISTFTIGLDTPDKMRAKVLEAEPYPVLKVKLGTGRDDEILRTIRGPPTRSCGSTPTVAGPVKQAIRDASGARGVRRHRAGAAARAARPSTDSRPRPGPRAFPSSRTRAAWWRPTSRPWSAQVDGINIKLAKCGSLREALRMIAVARAHGMMVMVGCMIEISLGITAAAHFTPLVDIVDLDGAALLAADPFVGATIERGQVVLPAGPGLGVTRAMTDATPTSPSRFPSPRPTPTGFPRRWPTASCPAPGSWCRCGSGRWSGSWSRSTWRPRTLPCAICLPRPMTSPRLPAPLLRTAQWMAGYYGAPLGLTLKAVLPGGMWGESQVIATRVAARR